MSSRGGFTLLELIIMIVVAMIIAGTVMPSAHTMDDQELISDARILAADLEFCQARAIATGQTHRLLFRKAADRELYRVESPPGVLLDEPLTKQEWKRQLIDANGYGTDIVSADFNGVNAVIFDASGRPDAAGTVTLRRGDFTAIVTVHAVTGEVELDLP